MQGCERDSEWSSQIDSESGKNPRPEKLAAEHSRPIVHGFGKIRGLSPPVDWAAMRVLPDIHQSTLLQIKS